MDKEKFETSKETLRKLLAIQQQHTKQADCRKNESDQVVYERLDGLIADAAADLLAVYADDDEEKPVKSEMPCNCRQEKTLPEFAAKTASCVFEVPKYKEEVVPAILVPLQEALDETKAQSTDKQNYVYMVFRVGETGAR